MNLFLFLFFFFSSRRRHTRSLRDWSSDVCSSDLLGNVLAVGVTVHGHALPRAPAEELVQRQPGDLGLDVPQGDVDRGDRGHGHRSTALVFTLVATTQIYTLPVHVAQLVQGE